jgi:hypothetical protein
VANDSSTQPMIMSELYLDAIVFRHSRSRGRRSQAVTVLVGQPHNVLRISTSLAVLMTKITYFGTLRSQACIFQVPRSVSALSTCNTDQSHIYKRSSYSITHSFHPKFKVQCGARWDITSPMRGKLLRCLRNPLYRLLRIAC